MQALALEIRALRAERGMSQEDLAGRAEIDRPYISLIEVGRKQPSLSVLYRLASAFDLSLTELVERMELRYGVMQDVERRSEPARKRSGPS